MSRLSVALIGLGPGAEPHAKSLLDLADRASIAAVLIDCISYAVRR
jgi:hypothetical protein